MLFLRIYSGGERKENESKQKKFELAKARSCIGRKEILAAGFPDGTLRGVVSGRNIKPETVGRLAKIMGVDVLDLIEEE